MNSIRPQRTFNNPHSHDDAGFSLAEVVLALGVVAFSIVAILGVLPTGLNTSSSAQNETRAAQIAQGIFTSIASQAQSKFPSADIVQPSPSPSMNYHFDLGSKHTYDTLAANNDGALVALASTTDAPKYPYYISVRIDPNPAGFDSGYASVVTVRVAWQPFAQNYRDFVRIFSKY